MTVLGLVPQTQIQLPHLTAIDDEDLARDEACAGAGEEGGGVGDFLDRAEAAERDFALDPALPGFRALLRVPVPDAALEKNVAGRDGVDAQTLLAGEFRELAREVIDAALEAA